MVFKCLFFIIIIYSKRSYYLFTVHLVTSVKGKKKKHMSFVHIDDDILQSMLLAKLLSAEFMFDLKIKKFLRKTLKQHIILYILCWCFEHKTRRALGGQNGCDWMIYNKKNI